ncbi:unnamed protein product [Heterobilharzia americana]|nr:unnamed protein product [Heterobilharzia americana]
MVGTSHTPGKPGDLICLCIGGRLFVTRRATLYRLPDSRLYLIATQGASNQEPNVNCTNQAHPSDDFIKPMNDSSGLSSNYLSASQASGRVMGNGPNEGALIGGASILPDNIASMLAGNMNLQSASSICRNRGSGFTNLSSNPSHGIELSRPIIAPVSPASCGQFPALPTPVVATPPTVYFYDRDPEIFRFVLDYYRTGELHLPSSICGPFVRKELIFWGIDEALIGPCCMPAYMRYDEEKRTKNTLFRDCFEDIDSMQNLVKFSRGWKKWRYRMWLFMDHPTSSLAAKIWASVLLVLMIASMMCYCLSTHEVFRTRSTVITSNTDLQSIISSTPTSHNGHNDYVVQVSPTNRLPYHTNHLHLLRLLQVQIYKQKTRNINRRNIRGDKITKNDRMKNSLMTMIEVCTRFIKRLLPTRLIHRKKCKPIGVPKTNTTDSMQLLTENQKFPNSFTCKTTVSEMTERRISYRNQINSSTNLIPCNMKLNGDKLENEHRPSLIYPLATDQFLNSLLPSQLSSISTPQIWVDAEELDDALSSVSHVYDTSNKNGTSSLQPVCTSLSTDPNELVNKAVEYHQVYSRMSIVSEEIFPNSIQIASELPSFTAPNVPEIIQNDYEILSSGEDGDDEQEDSNLEMKSMTLKTKFQNKCETITIRRQSISPTASKSRITNASVNCNNNNTNNNKKLVIVINQLRNE